MIPFSPAALVPAYHCKETVADVVSGVIPHVNAVLVIDDGSDDGTAEAARAAGAGVIVHHRNQGKGAAVRTGLGELLPQPITHVAFVDADGQHDPEDLPRLLDAARRGADFVIGSRFSNRETMPAKNYWANSIGDRVLSRMTGLSVEDGQSGYRVISARILRKLHLISRRYAIENEILIKSCRQVQRLEIVPIRTIYAGGRKHYRPFRDTWITSWASVHFKTTGSEES